MARVREELSRDLSLFDITMIGVGAMIGAGIFVLTGIAAGTAGPALILVFALNGVIAFMTAMSYAELGSAIPEAGGGYVWVKHGLPGPNAYLVGWMNWFAQAVAGSLYGLGFSSYVLMALRELLGLEIGVALSQLMHKGLAVLVILFFLWINFRGASETGKIGNVVTVAKVLILVLFISSGLWAIATHPDDLIKFHDFVPFGWLGIASAMGLIFIAFEGFDIIVQAGEEVKNPRVNIPKAVFLSLAIVIPVYLLVAFVSLGAVDPGADIPTYRWLAEHAELGVAEAARQFMPLGMVLLLAGGLLSTMSALNAATYSATRVSFAMGRDRYLPDAVAQVHERTHTPYKALLLSGALVLFMAVAIPIDDVAAASAIMFLLLFLMVNVALLSIRKRYGEQLRYGYLVPFFPLIPVVAILTQLFLAASMFNFSPIAWYFALGWIGLGLMGYLFYGRPRSEEETRTPVMAVEKRTPEPTETGYRVLVPIANPESLERLAAPALEAARRHDGSVTLLHVVTVPEQLPLSAGRAFIKRSQPLTDRALELAERTDVPVEVVTRLSHRPARAIIDTAHEKRIDLLIMGWRGRSRSPHTLIGRNIDLVVERVHGEVLVLQQTAERAARRVLVPIANRRALHHALEMALLLKHEPRVRIEVLHVFHPKASQSERERFMERLRRRIDRFREAHPQFRGAIAARSVTGTRPVRAIVAETREGGYDYLVLGTPTENWVRRRFFTSVPAQIARLVDTPVALVRPRGGALGFGLHRLIQFVQGEIGEPDERSRKELEEAGFLQSESAGRANRARARSPARKTGLLALGLVGLGSAALIYLGYGRLWTWIGAVGFLIALWAFTAVSLRYIERD